MGTGRGASLYKGIGERESAVHFGAGSVLSRLRHPARISLNTGLLAAMKKFYVGAAYSNRRDSPAAADSGERGAGGVAGRRIDSEALRNGRDIRSDQVRCEHAEVRIAGVGDR